jgi:GLTT repeat (6 copies)
MLPLTPAVQEWLVELTQVPYHAVQWPEWYGQTTLSAGALACEGRTVLLTLAWTAGLAEAGLAEAGLAEAGLAEAGLAEAGLAEAGLAEAGIAATDATASVLAKPIITTVKIERIGIMGS